MRTFIPWLVALGLLLSGCATHRLGGGLGGNISAPNSGSLRSGDLVVAVTRSARRHAVLRVHRGAGLGQRVEQLFLSEWPIRHVAASADGRWLALEQIEGSGDTVVRLWDFRAFPGAAEPAAVYTSPRGCSAPDFEGASRWMVLGCEPEARQPASVLRVDLPTGSELLYVGESGRRAPSVTAPGDVYWSERRERHSVAVRHSPGSSPFVTHDLTQPILEMWPQTDGAIVVELERRGSRRSFARLSTSGWARRVDPPLPLADDIRRGDLLHVGERGIWWLGRCERGACSIRSARAEREGKPITLKGSPTALAEVSWPRRRSEQPEDLATAPGSVLHSHSASQISVLGVSLGMSVADSFAMLDSMGRHPYWIEGRGARERVRGIGVGWTAEGHCIEYLADDRGSVAAIELRSCSTSYLSPALRPLLDHTALAGTGGSLARRFLGDSLSVERGRVEPAAVGRGVVRTDLSFMAPERGLSFEARSEVLGGSEARLLGGWVRLRLEMPGRGQVTLGRSSGAR